MNREAESALRAVAEHFAATREDLQRIALTIGESRVPLLGTFAREVLGLLTGRTLDTYRPHVERLVEEFGARRLDEITQLELEKAAIDVRAEARLRPASRHGFGAQESFVNATRFLFTCAVKAGHLSVSPAGGLQRPRRRRSTRRALSSEELVAIFHAAMATSRDPALDMLILAFARETACRREGLLNLKLDDVHTTPSVLLYEKFDQQREIPVSASLRLALLVHAADRQATDSVFHYGDGRPLTDRRFDTLFRRVGKCLPWARSLGVSLHWIRYTTLTDIRMTSGERVAAAYAGHGDEDVTSRYTRATFEELQAAHRRLFGR